MSVMIGLSNAKSKRLIAKNRCIKLAPNVGQSAVSASDEYVELSKLAASKTFKPDDTVFWQGDASQSYFLVSSGVMRGVRFLEDGRRQVTRFMFPGDLIVHKGGEGYIYGGEAITPVEVKIIPRKKLDRRADIRPKLADVITRSILAELRETQDHLVVLGQLSADERVAHFLCSLREKMPKDGSEEIDIPMSRIDIADYLGLTIETVSRVISRLRRDGKISLPTSNKLTVMDPLSLDHHHQTFAA